MAIYILYHLLGWPEGFSKLLLLTWDPTALFSNCWKAPVTGENTGEWAEENSAIFSESSIGVEMRSLARPNLFGTDPLFLLVVDGGVKTSPAGLGVTFPFEDFRGDCGTGSQWRCWSTILSTSEKSAASNSKPNDKLNDTLGDGAFRTCWLT